MKRTELMQLLTVAALWGSSYLFMRLGAGEFGAFALAGVRALGACLLMLPLLALREGFGDWRRDRRPGPRNRAIASFVPGAARVPQALS